MKCLDYKVRTVINEAKLYLEIHDEDDKHFVKAEDFVLILREIIENEKGFYRLNKPQSGGNYVHEAFYDEVCLITVTDKEIGFR